jgi:hypothetical protein
MRAVFLTAVTAFIISSSTLTAPSEGATIKLAMGPTSAAHLPGGSGQSTASSGCSGQTCPTGQKKGKHAHQN